MSEVTRLPTKFGQGHADAIGFIQDEVLARIISNKMVTLAIIGITDDGDEICFRMSDVSGERMWNLRTLGMLAELQTEWANDMLAAKVETPNSPTA